MQRHPQAAERTPQPVREGTGATDPGPLGAHGRAGPYFMPLLSQSFRF